MADSDYKKIITEDGSISLFSRKYDQAMHSTSGAYQEAFLKHIYPSEILNNCRDDLFALDVGFGIGYNVLALVVEFLKNNPRNKLNIISFEKEKSFYKLMETICFADEREQIYEKIRMGFLTGKIQNSNFTLEIIYGDARNSIKKLRNISFDAVFHDPYSPSKNPELWSVDFFREIYKVISPQGILTTYSSASQIRGALIEAGFYIGKGPSVGKKKEGTIASRSNNINNFSDDDIIQVISDAKSVPYRDFNLNQKREDILNNRIEEMRKRRLN